jgi:spore coat protein H
MTHVALLFAMLATRAAAAPLATPEDLFATQKIWSVHLTFTPEQWTALEREDAAGRGVPFEGPPTALGRRLLARGDSNGDARLSKEEVLALGHKWWATSGVPHGGCVDLNGVQAAVRAFLPVPGGAAGDGAGPGGPPGPPRLHFEYTRADLEFEGQKLAQVAVRYKGNNTFMGSRGSLKRPFKLDLDRGSPGQSLAGVTKLNLHNSVNDATWMNEALSYRLFRDAGVPAPRTAYAEVSLTVRGQYDRRPLGLYALVENVDREFLLDRFGSAAGALLKPETPRLFEDLGSDWAAYERAYVPKPRVDGESAARVMALSRLVSHASDGEFAARIGEYLDLDQFARFMAVTVWLSSMDSLLSMGHNFYVYLRPDTHRFQFIPWDLDHSFGQFPMAGAPGELAQLNIAKPWRGASRFLERVYRLETFRDLYVARLRTLNDTLARPERLAEQVDALAARLRPAIQHTESVEKLARFDAAVNGERDAALVVAAGSPRARSAAVPPASRLAFRPAAPPFPSAGGVPGGGDRSATAGGPGAPPGSAARPVSPIKRFLRERSMSVAAQLSTRGPDLMAATSAESRFEPRSGPFGPGGFDPVAALASTLLSRFDTDKSGAITDAELSRALDRHFDAWDVDRSGTLTADELSAGFASDLLPFPPPPPAPEVTR